MSSSRNALLVQANSYAMLHGLYFGLLGALSVALFRIGLDRPVAMLAAYAVTLASPVVAVWLTRRFRDEVTAPGEGFSYTRAYTHSLLMGIYSSLVIALFVLVYFVWFDKGSTVDAYARQLAQMTTPETAAMMRQMTGGLGTDEVVRVLREMKPADFAYPFISTNIFVAPVMSLLVAAFSWRRPSLVNN
ncbi:MAG: DUF4199 domain-containing protein [Bacteroidaceae bacterium]|nr:DUF4199 domain-containing protein [Bacteroidaceae bacterium]